MIKEYKGYKIVDSNGLKELLKNEYLCNNEDFYNFLYKNKVCIIDRKSKCILQNNEGFVDYETLRIKNKLAKLKAKTILHIISISGQKCLVENLCGTVDGDILLERLNMKDIINKIYDCSLYVNNISLVKGYLK